MEKEGEEKKREREQRRRERLGRGSVGVQLRRWGYTEECGVGEERKEGGEAGEKWNSTWQIR